MHRTDNEGKYVTLRPLFQGVESISALLAEGTAVLTPNRRLSRAVITAQQKYRRDCGEAAWQSSTVLPLRQFWIERWHRAVTRGLLPGKTIVDATAQRIIWRRVIDADREVPFSLLSPMRAAVLAQEAHERLALWRIDLNDIDVHQFFVFDEDSRAFLRWEEGFRQALEELGGITPEQALEQLLACPGAMDQGVALLSQDDLPPLHQALCAASPTWQRLSLPARQAHLCPTQPFNDPRAELQTAARWCRAQFEKDPTGRYAVVLSDMHNDRDRLEYYLRQEFGCLTQNYASLPVNFATGFTLDRVPLVRDALRILEFSMPEIDVENVVAILQSRFITPPRYQLSQREKCIRQLRELGKQRIPPRVMRSALDALLDKAVESAPWETVFQLEANGRWQKRARPPSQWLEPIRAILSAWGWPEGAALDSLEYQQAGQWQETLDAFAALDLFTGPLSFTQAITSLRELLSEQQFQPRTDDQAVQVLGPLETTGLYFDAIWVTGMTATRWPAAAQPNPYLPHSLQRQQRMPHADASWERNWANMRWQQWMGGAGELQTSYVDQIDGAEALPSPLLRASSKDDARAEAAAVEDWRTDERWLNQAQSAIFDPVALGPVALHAYERGSQGVGAAVLEQQSVCPFQAFAAARLHTSPTPGLSAGLLPSERGTLLHRALYSLWGEFKDRTGLVSASEAQLHSTIEASLGYAESGLPKDRLDLLGGDVIALERKRLDSVLRRWLMLESNRTEAFSVIAREDPREHELGGLHLRLRVDRVDRLADGDTLIVDYKSGAIGSVNQWLGERPTRPQLPLYGLLPPEAAGIAYASLKPGAEGFKGIGERDFVPGIAVAATFSEDQNTGGMGELRQMWHHELSLIAAEFVAGQSAVDPTQDACRYCQRFSLCRISEAAL